MDKTPLIYPMMAAIQGEVEAIAKGRKNTKQGYNFRGVEDVLNMMHSLLVKYKVFVATRRVGTGIVEERATRSGGNMVYRVNDYEFDFIAEDGSKVTVGPIPGEGADSGDKAANKTMANAYKYAMFLTFSIPTQGLVDEPDAESPQTGNGKSTNGGQTAQKSGQTKGRDEQNSGQSGDYQALRAKLDDLLNSGGFDEKEVKQARTMASKINPKDTQSLSNLIKAWEKKKLSVENVPQSNQQQKESTEQREYDPVADGQQDLMSPEQVARAVGGEIVNDQIPY